MKILYPTLGVLVSMMFPTSLKAQFHQKSSTGQTAPRQMNNPFNSPAGYKPPGTGVRKLEGSKLNVVGISPKAMEMADKVARETGSHIKIGIATMSLKNADVWGRAENHPDGTYTETIFDHEKKQADNIVIQETKRKNMEGDDPVILTRKITFNHMGQPEQVMIYDGSGRYKYHGLFVYDAMGRLIEQQLRSANGAPLRRVIQEYSPTGDYLPLKTCDYVDNVPKDLQLVITKSNDIEQQQLEEMNRLLYEAAESKGFLANRKRKKAEAAAQKFQEQFQSRNAAPRATASAAPSATAKEAGGKRFQLFKRRK